MSDRGFFGIGVWHSKSSVNIGTLWRSAQAFGASFVFTVGARYSKQPSDCTKAWKHLPVLNYRDMEDLRNHLPYSCVLVAVEIHPKAKPLPKYGHPLSACYLLGAEDHGLSDDAIYKCHELIAIPGASRCLNVASAGTVIMYDRIAKSGGHTE